MCWEPETFHSQEDQDTGYAWLECGERYPHCTLRAGECMISGDSGTSTIHQTKRLPIDPD